MSGKPLDPELVYQARCEELQEFKRYEVYDKAPLEDCYRITGKPPIGIRWVDVNKGDEVNPNYRSRLVVKEIKKGQT